MSLPILVRPDGQMFNQAQTLMRYIGKKYGYYPADAKDAYEVDKLSDDFYDKFNALFGPGFCPAGSEAQKQATVGAVAAMSSMCKDIAPRLAKGQFLFGSKLCTVDFWFGGVYTNIMTNPDAYGREEWAAFLKAHPAFEAYGKRFAEANADYLGRRHSAPL